MTTVEEINTTFAEKGVGIRLPLPADWVVNSLEVLQKHHRSGGVRVLLAVRYRDDQGKDRSDIILCEGPLTSPTKPSPVQGANNRPRLKRELLPTPTAEFTGEEEAVAYLRGALLHLLGDNGYVLGQHPGCDLYLTKGEQAFFANLAARCDEEATQGIEALVALRVEHGPEHEYGLLIPAFQESLGVPLRVQERWISDCVERLSANRVGIYAVNNRDPNQLYAFASYPKPRELMRYFVATTARWALLRQNYVANRRR